MKTVTTNETPAKWLYLRLLQNSYFRARQVMEEMERNPAKFSLQHMRDTADYLAQLEKELHAYMHQTD
jgi:hypothetical protein